MYKIYKYYKNIAIPKVYANIYSNIYHIWA